MEMSRVKNKLKITLCVAAAVACFSAGFFTAKALQKNSEPKITATAISERLSSCSDLTTAALDYRGLIKYSDGNIPIINKKSFSMVYHASVKSGIDLSGAKITVSNDKINIKLPEAQVQSVNVDTENLEFYDEKLALFNWTDREDTAIAIELAKEDVEKNADITGLKSQATKQAQNVVKSLIEPVAEDRDIVVE